MAFASGLELTIALLFLWTLLSQIDVPVRGTFSISVLTPVKGAATTSFTAVPRSLASAISFPWGGASGRLRRAENWLRPGALL